MAEPPPIPPWCKPKAWVYHPPSNTVFQAMRLEIDQPTNTYYLRDNNSIDYPLAECQELTPRTLTAPATLAGFRGPLTIAPYPQKTGWIIQAGKQRKGVIIPDAAEAAAQSLARLFKGTIYSEEINHDPTHPSLPL